MDEVAAVKFVRSQRPCPAMMPPGLAREIAAVGEACCRCCARSRAKKGLAR